MKHEAIRSALTRRQLLTLAASGLAAGAWPLLGRADDKKKFRGGGSAAIALAQTGITNQHVVVVGGGMAGMTAAKYLRLWGGSGLQVTLVEPDSVYTSSIMSNLVLNGSRSVASLQLRRDALSSRYGVVRKAASLASIAVDAHEVTLSDNTVLRYDRLVLAPGVVFDDAYGLKQSQPQSDYDTRTPHAWRAGAQTTLLRNQIATMKRGETFVMTIPKAPYRCPPGPYERACLVADYLKTAKGSDCRVVVLDENLAIQAERHTFEQAFTQVHAGVIDYVPGASEIVIDPVSRRVSYLDPVGTPQQVQARVVNPIPPHRATGSEPGGWLVEAGLANGPGERWAGVDVLSYESTALPNSGIHVVGDAAVTGMPKAGHVANQEAKICADAIVRLLSGMSPDPAPVANSACYSPITARTASWLTAVYQYDTVAGQMKIASGGGRTKIGGVPAAATESATISGDNFEDMGIWFETLMRDTAG